MRSLNSSAVLYRSQDFPSRRRIVRSLRNRRRVLLSQPRTPYFRGNTQIQLLSLRPSLSSSTQLEAPSETGQSFARYRFNLWRSDKSFRQHPLSTRNPSSFGSSLPPGAQPIKSSPPLDAQPINRNARLRPQPQALGPSDRFRCDFASKGSQLQGQSGNTSSADQSAASIDGRPRVARLYENLVDGQSERKERKR